MRHYTLLKRGKIQIRSRTFPAALCLLVIGTIAGVVSLRLTSFIVTMATLVSNIALRVQRKGPQSSSHWLWSPNMEKPAGSGTALGYRRRVIG
jgi:ribose/xylose/arabinose/galactoside ABC-type transport system permease subunit